MEQATKYWNVFLNVVQTKYAQFQGRADKMEFWSYVLVYIVLAIAVSIVGAILRLDILITIFQLALLVPSFAVGARRLHDIGRTGWWQLLVLIPIIGLIVLIYFWVQNSQQGENQFGANPQPTAN
ncbi:MAG: DUF805 domain-containing protein [Azoarcus sp.]|jgi:uncharacterized membrane protein YhaH (DUF805 family)|nr:DUF805 domain-containing protein [Azoarcus sp.]